MSRRATPYRLRKATEDEDVRTFIARVKQRTDQLGLSLTEFARALDCDHAAVSGWFSMRYRPAAHLMLRMPDVLGVTADWLFLGRGPMTLEGQAEPSKADFYRGADTALNDMADALKQVQEFWALQMKKAIR